jgi:hypothetical protein
MVGRPRIIVRSQKLCYGRFDRNDADQVFEETQLKLAYLASIAGMFDSAKKEVTQRVTISGWSS